MTRTPRPLDLERLLRTLTDFGVEFVVVGGLAVIAHGHERATTDLDICYAQTQSTARALLRALSTTSASCVRLHNRQALGRRQHALRAWPRRPTLVRLPDGFRPSSRSRRSSVRHLNARLLDADDREQPLPADFRALQHGDVSTFTTDAGDLDCMTAPDGTTGFGDVAPGALEVPFRGIVVRVASLDDLIRMKRASGQKQRRAKDRGDLEELLRIRAEPQTDTM